jgi:hypothetical protein
MARAYLLDAVLCLPRVLVFLHFGRVFCIVVVVVVVFIIVVVWPMLAITYLCFIDIVTYAFLIPVCNFIRLRFSWCGP